MSLVLKIPPLIVERVKAGEPVIRVATRLAITSYSGYQRLLDAFRNLGVKPRQGQRPLSIRAYRGHFDKKAGSSGAWKTYLKDAKRLTCEELAEEYGFTSRQWAHRVFAKISGGLKKPTVWSKPRSLLRPDVTAGKIKRLAPLCRSKAEIARRLKTDINTVGQRISAHGITLPDYQLLRQAEIESRSRQAQQLQKRGRTINEIAAILEKCEATISNYIRRAKFNRRSKRRSAT